MNPYPVGSATPAGGPMCILCGKPKPLALQRKIQSKFCGRICANQYTRLRQFADTSLTGLPSPTVGAVGEMRVACDLLMRGYEVFRALSPSARCDLIALTAGTILKVEVTTARPSVSGGGLYYTKHLEARYEFDVLALVTHDGAITYQPDVPRVAPRMRGKARNQHPVSLEA